MMPPTKLLLLGLSFLCHVTGFSIPQVIDKGVEELFNAQKNSHQTCPQPAYVSPHPSTEQLDSEEFRNISLTRFLGAIQHPTVSYDDLRDPLLGKPKDERWATFIPFHQYLEKTYPLVHSRHPPEVVNGYSLVFTIPGSTSKKPIMLTGHQDVVPASTALDEWLYPPFDGFFDGEWLWGRGASDCKSNVIGLLSLVEWMLESGFQPKRTIILAFGQDEEIGGPYGATQIGSLLQKRYGHNGIELIIDEGGLGLSEEFGPLMALPAMTEKGYVDLTLTVHGQGGHSSVPSKHTSVGALAHFIVAFEDTAMYEPIIEARSPLYHFLECVREHGETELVPEWLPSLLDSGDLKELAKKIANSSLQKRYLIETSNAATVAHGGVKVNALPEEAQAMFNTRLQIELSVEDHVERVTAAFLTVAKQLDISLFVGGKLAHQGGMGTTASLNILASFEPSPIGPMRGENWKLFSQAVVAVFGSDTIVSPTLSTSNTDTRHYHALSEHIYRWTPAREGTRLNSHGVNERIKLTTHIEAIQFYHELIRAFD